MTNPDDSGQSVSKKLRNLHALFVRPSRRNELHIFSRLLYRNRNQHRHGLYFHRLEGVRRTAEKIGRHRFWEVLLQDIVDADREAEEEEGKLWKKRRRKGGKKEMRKKSDTRKKSEKEAIVVFSSIMLNDLEEIELLLERFLERDILNAAQFVTHQLISREHFLAFSTCVVACLAKLHHLEQRLLEAVRGTLVEMRIALGVSESINQEMAIDVAGNDDVGEVVALEKEGARIGEVAEDLEIDESENGQSKKFDSEEREAGEKECLESPFSSSSESKSASQAATHSMRKMEAPAKDVFKLFSDTDGGSTLYDVMEVDTNSSKTSIIEANTDRAAVSIDISPLSKLQGASAREENHPKSLQDVKTEKSVHPMHTKVGGNNPNYSKGREIAVEKDDVDSSSSSDIDDIFSALD